MASKRKPITDARRILLRRHYAGKPNRLADLDAARSEAEVARKIYQLRKDAGLTQRQLAELVGTTASVICRLEDDDYRGHSLSMLRRIATVLGKRIQIRFIPMNISQG